MEASRVWITPFLKQCFVATGIFLGMTSCGMVVGFGAALLEQLRRPEAAIPLDDTSGSWIASIPGLFQFTGNLLVVPIMGKYGRRIANLISISVLIIGWLGIIFASDIVWLFIARSLQGIFLGMNMSIASLLLGEYTSPKNRGGFLMTLSVSISFGVFFVHIIGCYMLWRTGAVLCGVLAVMSLLIVFFSPESPSWLLSQGRYEECKRIFRWLRGEGEEEELGKMIEASIIDRETKLEVHVSRTFLKKIQKSIIYFNTTVRKREFYRPLIIMIHIYTLSLWGGVNFLIVYATDYFHRLIGNDVDTALLIVTLDAQRLISNILAVYIVKKVRRRPMLFTTVGITIAALVAIAAYSYAKVNNALPFDHPIIGIILSHCMIFGVATGSLSLSLIIGGEIFPLEYKNLAGGISMIVFSANLFFILKSVPYLFATFGLHGTVCIKALVLVFCVSIAWIMLPETKDRTLQDIEDEFRGRKIKTTFCGELGSAQSLKSVKPSDSIRKCSTPS